MKLTISIILVLVGLMNFYPVIGVLSADTLRNLYGVIILDNDLLILMRHRAILFGILGIFMVISAFRPNLQPSAIVVGLISMMAFIGLALGTGEFHGQVSDWLKKDDDPAYQECSDTQLAIFLNGLINNKRGKREGAQPKPEARLNNNIIFMKLKIALNLKAEDVLEILELAEFRLSKHELSAFFRKPGHKHYRECKDQILRNFLQGMQLKYRGNI